MNSTVMVKNVRTECRELILGLGLYTMGLALLGGMSPSSRVRDSHTVTGC